LVEAGSFRSDLLYRLNRLSIRIPALRERPDDILPLAEHFLAEGREDGRRPEIAEGLARWFREQQWLGNVRELRSFLERLRRYRETLSRAPGRPAAGACRHPRGREGLPARGSQPDAPP
jgi:DNA-binding NtrC family response regulator